MLAARRDRVPEPPVRPPHGRRRRPPRPLDSGIDTSNLPLHQPAATRSRVTDFEPVPNDLLEELVPPGRRVGSHCCRSVLEEGFELIELRIGQLSRANPRWASRMAESKSPATSRVSQFKMVFRSTPNHSASSDFVTSFVYAIAAMSRSAGVLSSTESTVRWRSSVATPDKCSINTAIREE